MKKGILLSIALLLGASTCMAEETPMTEAEPYVISFEANMTTGFAWNGFVFSGDCVELDSAEGSYVTDEVDEADEPLCGVGGTTYYTLTPVKPGRSLVLFDYTQGWEPEFADRVVMLVTVDEDMHLEAMDITESSRIEGTVVSVDEETREVLMESEELGDLIATFEEDMELPFVDEEIMIYTDGIMTMSLPAHVNALAWETIPSELAREMETE